MQHLNNRYRILIADDDRMTQRLLSSFLENLGYKVTSALEGNAALAEIQKCHYDLLISDVIMPGIDGVQLTKIIRNMDRYHNLPIILLSAKNSTCAKVEGFEALADDYVTKPFDFDELGARIKTQLRLKHLQEEIEHKNILLSKRNLELEAHLDIAKHFQRKLLPLDTKEIYGVEISSFYKPIDKVGGDIFDLIPLRDGRVGIFIGDVSGHGVPAAFLNIMLKMAVRSIVKEEEEVSPSNVLKKINSRIAAYTQDDEFVTALYATVDANNKMLYFASAGHPQGIILREKGGLIEPLESRGLCMGIMDNVTYEENALKLSPGDRIIYYTDGLTELRDSKGRMLGTRGLYEIVERCRAHQTLDKMVSGIVSEIERLCEDAAYEDDLTILCIEIRDTFCHSWSTRHFNIQDAIETLITPLTSLPTADTKDIKKVKIALQEAISNAVEHGNLELPPSLKNFDSDDTIYEELKRERMTDPTYGKKKVTAKYLIHDDKITYFIKDEGPGFNHKNVKDPTSPENIDRCYGRGIALMRMCMDEVSFSDKGNEIRLIKNFSS